MKTRLGVLIRLFREFFLISLFVVGGGYAILAVADQVFGRRLKWLKEGELIEKLPVFQMVPGLIAGNTAIYTGRKLAGRLGTMAALLGVALPSFLVFLAVTMGFATLPKDNIWLEGAFLGLRSALTGIVAATLVKSWRRTVKGIFGYVIAITAIVLLVPAGVNPIWVIIAAMVAGIVRKTIVPDLGDLGHSGTSKFLVSSIRPNLPEAPKDPKAPTGAGDWAQWFHWLGVTLFLAISACFYLDILLAFLKFGCVAFGGGFVLVPMYVAEFTGPEAPLLQLPMEEFSNLIALTQTTPGPVSVNAATFFGYRMGGVIGSAVATAALLLPSYLLLPMVLSGLEKGRDNRIVTGLMNGVRPATNALLVTALVIFSRISIYGGSGVCPLGGIGVCPLALGLALFAAERAYRGRWPILAVIALCALVGIAAKFIVKVY